MAGVLDLDPHIKARRKELVRGIVQDNDRFIMRTDGYDSVRWTGADGVVNESKVKCGLFEYTPIVFGRL